MKKLLHFGDETPVRISEKLKIELVNCVIDYGMEIIVLHVQSGAISGILNVPIMHSQTIASRLGTDLEEPENISGN